MATQAQTALLVLKKLQLVDAGGSGDANELAEAEAAVALSYEELAELGVAYWSLSDIPDRVKDPVASHAAGFCSEQLIGESPADASGRKELALRHLHRLASSGQVEIVIKGAFF